MVPTSPPADAVPREPMLLRRERLVGRLDAAASGPLTVVTAPAGYGKSLLLEQWAARHEQRVVIVRFEEDDDRDRVADALAGWGADGNGQDGRCLVLEGIDVVRDPGLADEVRALVERPPAGLHLVVARRSREPAWLERRCRQGGVTCLEAADLAFTAAEVRQVVAEVARRELTDGQIDLLLSRTWGWPVAVQLATMALRDTTDAEAALEAVSGHDPYVAAFLRSEVLDREQDPVRRFLVRTSVLATPSGEVCDALLGGRAGALMLRLLAHRNLFVRQVGDEPATFAFHPLLREVLRRERPLVDPTGEDELLRRGAAWYEHHGQVEAAATCLVEAGDWPGILDLVDRAGPDLFERGTAARAVPWLEAVPQGDPVLRTRVRLRLAYLHMVLGRSQLAEQEVHDLRRSSLTAGDRLAVEALRATLVFAQGSAESAIAAADEVLAGLDDGTPDDLPNVLGLTSAPSMRTMAGGSRARALWCTGAVDPARRSLRALVRQRDGYPPWRIHCLSALALLEAWAGNLHRAMDLSRQAQRLAAEVGVHRHHPALADAYHAGAHVFRERGQVHQASALLLEADVIARRVRRPRTSAINAVERVLLHLATGRPQLGLAELERHRREADGHVLAPVIEDRLLAAEVRSLLAVGEPGRAEALLASAPSLRAPELAGAAVQVVLAGSGPGAAHAAINGWTGDEAEPRGRLERSLWLALVDLEAGHRRRALQRGGRVVDAARGEGHVRLFLDAGPYGERLLRALATSRPDPYLARLVRATSLLRPSGGPGPSGLSERELEIVRYLPTPLSNADIAAALYVSLNTLKTHLRTIYRKLGVRGRDEAIERVEALGIA